MTYLHVAEDIAQHQISMTLHDGEARLKRFRPESELEKYRVMQALFTTTKKHRVSRKKCDVHMAVIHNKASAKHNA